MMTQDQAIKALVAQYERVKQVRYLRMQRVEKMRRYTFPHKAHLTSPMGAGDNAWQAIYDNMGQTAASECAANLFTHMCPTDQQWFLLTPPAADPRLAEDREYQEYLARQTERLHQAMAQSNWATEGHSACEDLMDGTCCVEVGKDSEEGKPFLLQTLDMDEYAFLGGVGARIHTVFGELQLTAYEAAERFGLDKLPKALQDALADLKDNAYVDTAPYINVMRPNKDWEPASLGSKRFRYESLWIDGTHKTLLKRQGMRRLRRIVARFRPSRKLAWGFGPTDSAYGSVRGLDKAVEIFLKYGSMKMNPPSVWPDDGAFWPQDATPGSIIVGRLGATDKGRPDFLEVQGDHRIGDFIINYLAGAVARAYMSEAFQILRDRRQKTAREVVSVLEKQYDVWIPPTWRIKQELIDPLILNELEMLTEQDLGIEGWMYGGQSLPDFRYDLTMISPLFLAMQYAQLQRVSDAFAVLSPWAEIDPAIWDSWSLDEISHVVQECLGIPNRMRRSASAVRQIREARAEILAQQAAVEQAKTAAEATSKLSKGVEANSPMEMAFA